jgi:hypothetical protein
MDVSCTLKSNLPALDGLAERCLREAVRAGADATVELAKELIAESVGSGNKYPELPKRSSAPGEVPVNQTDALLASIRTDDSEMAAGVIGADAVAGTEYAAYLELGTHKMAPRPFLGEGYAASAGELAMEASVAESPAKLAQAGI